METGESAWFDLYTKVETKKMDNDNDFYKALIHDILEKNYVNFATRRNYGVKIQESTISQNRGLKMACATIIENSSNVEELTEYFKSEIQRIEQGEEQQVLVKE